MQHINEFTRAFKSRKARFESAIYRLEHHDSSYIEDLLEACELFGALQLLAAQITHERGVCDPDNVGDVRPMLDDMRAALDRVTAARKPEFIN